MHFFTLLLQYFFLYTKLLLNDVLLTPLDLLRRQGGEVRGGGEGAGKSEETGERHGGDPSGDMREVAAERTW